MSKPKSKGARSTKDAGAGGGKGKGKSAAREQSAIRGMLLGAAIIAALAGFFMLPVNGKTTFTHLIHALGLQGGESETAKDAAKDTGKTGAKAGGTNPSGSAPRATPARTGTAAAGGSRVAPTGVRPIGGLRSSTSAARASPPAKPLGIKVASGMKTRAPLEAASADDDAALDRIVRRHTQN
ncbi:hypothetical protein L6V77_31110 [Myxococcota bacterium]|nr:hypothetical protein [Myxococcota bacterium]